MSLTTANALKAWLESQGLGVAVYRDRLTEDKALPYITVSESISITGEPAFNSFDDPEGHVREVAQVDLWQRWLDPMSNTLGESPTLADAVMLALDGKRATTAPTWVGGMTVDGAVRLLNVEGNYVHTAITVSIRRTLHRTGAVLPGDPTPLPVAPADTYGGY